MASGTAANLEYDYVSKAQRVEIVAGSTGSYKAYNLLTNATGNVVTVVTSITSAAGSLGGYSIINLSAAPIYVLIWDTLAAVTIGTTIPSTVIPIPANNASNAAGAMANTQAINQGITNKIQYCLSTLPGTTGAVVYTQSSPVISGTLWIA